MSDIVVGIKLKADGSGLVGQLTNAKGQVVQFGNATSVAGQKAKQSSRNIVGMEIAGGKLLSKLAVLAPALITTFASTVLIRGLIDTTRRFEILKASLETATGSADNANKVFREIQRIASTTPYAVEEITTAFIKLTNLGLNPGQESLRSYMNTASAMGKSLDQFIEAVADASVAEFERLKEFGIKAKNQGDTIAFTFRGVKTEVKNNAQEIEGYLQSLGNTQFGGAMARQAKTLDGAISNMGDSWDGLKFTIAEAGVSELMQKGVRGVSSALDELTNLIASGQLGGYLDALAGQWQGWSNDVLGSVDTVTSLIPPELEQLFTLLSEYDGAYKNLLLNSLKQYPQNVRAMIKVLTVELASLVDVGTEYGGAFGDVLGTQLSYLPTVAKIYITSFGNVLGTELASIVNKMGIYGQEILDLLNPFDGDTFNVSAALSQADAIANGMTNSYLKARDDQLGAATQVRDQLVAGYLDGANQQIAISRDARAATLQDIFDEREASLNSFTAQIAAANALGAARKQAAANDEQFDLGQFGVTPDKSGASKGDPVTDSELDKLRESLLSQEQLLEQHWLKRSTLLANAWSQNKIGEDEFISLSLTSNKQYYDQLDAYNVARNNLILSSSQQIFGAMAGLAKTFGGEQSKAYKVMFAVQKGFAIAQGVMNLATAISNASATPWPANFAAMAVAASEGANLVSTIKGVNYGQAHDGIRQVTKDNEGTYVVRRDEMVLNPKQRENFEQVVANTKGGGAGGGNTYNFNPVINIDATNATPGMELKIKQQVDNALNEFDGELQRDFANGGQRARLLNGRAA
jgi:hypothetical protein